MQFTVAAIGQQLGFDAKAEIAEANDYPQIRTMTVGQKNASVVPLRELGAAPQLPWSVASNLSIGQGNFTATSAVCWFYARDLFLATRVPQGIISSNWGGTIIQSWSDNATNAKCPPTSLDLQLPVGVEGPEKFATTASRPTQPNPNAGYGVLFNAMIYPFAVGPISLNTFIWFQVVIYFPFSLASFSISYRLHRTPCIHPLFFLSRVSPTSIMERSTTDVRRLR
jgi:sialate O-acetylesterase